MSTKQILGVGGGLLVVAALLWWGATRNVAPTAQPLQDIRFGFIRSVNVDARTIEFDDAVWLTGEEAKDAAIAAGMCTQQTRDECTPNDYFILNAASGTVTLHLTEQPEIAMMTLHAESEGLQETSISLSEFGKLLNDTKLHWKDLPYQILLENNVITIVEEVYIP